MGLVFSESYVDILQDKSDYHKVLHQCFLCVVRVVVCMEVGEYFRELLRIFNR